MFTKIFDIYNNASKRGDIDMYAEDIVVLGEDFTPGYVVKNPTFTLKIVTCTNMR